MNLSPNELKEKLMSEFAACEPYLTKRNSPRYHRIRTEAINEFSEQGFPTNKIEDWRFTKLNFLFQNQFNLNLLIKKTQFEKELIEKFKFNEFFENILVFVNGFYSNELSKTETYKHIKIGSFFEMPENHDLLINVFFDIYHKKNRNAFSLLNTSFAADGGLISIPNDKEAAKPIFLLFINDVREQSIFSNVRNMIYVGDKNNAKIVESHITIGENQVFNNFVTQIFLGDNSRLDYYKLQNDDKNSYSIDSTDTFQSKESIFNSTVISLKGKFIRNNLNTYFNGVNASADFNGFYFLNGTDFVDNHTLADHAKPNCQSNELYKGIIDDKAAAVFNGKIIVRPDAQKTNAYQSNKNILLSDEASINTKPQLEIFADDVKCSHGATSGSLDQEAMFYLKTRGIGEDAAKALLLNAFASQVVEKIEIPEIRKIIKDQIAERLHVENDFVYNFDDENV